MFFIDFLQVGMAHGPWLPWPVAHDWLGPRPLACVAHVPWMAWPMAWLAWPMAFGWHGPGPRHGPRQWAPENGFPWLKIFVTLIYHGLDTVINHHLVRPIVLILGQNFVIYNRFCVS